MEVQPCHRSEDALAVVGQQPTARGATHANESTSRSVSRCSSSSGTGRGKKTSRERSMNDAEQDQVQRSQVHRESEGAEEEEVAMLDLSS